MLLFFAIFFIVLAVILCPKKTVSKLDPDELQEAVDLANKAFQDRVQNMKIDDAINPPLRDKTP